VIKRDGFYRRLQTANWHQRRSVAVNWLEVLLGDIPTDRASEVCAFQAGVPEVKASQGARHFDIPDGVAKALVLTRRLAHSAV
jgi:hypothetical protein